MIRGGSIFMSRGFVDAPSDGATYGRKDGAWAVVSDDPSLDWVVLAFTWTVEPVSQSYSGGDGEVYKYTYGSTVYYRFVPEPYDSAGDKFYAAFVDPVLSGLVATRGQSI